MRFLGISIANDLNTATRQYPRRPNEDDQDKKNIEFVNKKRTEINKKNSEQKKIAKEVYEKIKKKLIIFSKETKENGDLYGAIKPKEISKYFLDNFKQVIHPSQIDIKKDINKIGQFPITINLHSDLIAELRVSVEKKTLKK